MKEKFALAVIVAALSGTAWAAGTQSQTGTGSQPGAQSQMGAEGQSGAQADSLQALDTNMDGMVSEDEAQSNPELTNRWNELDTNGDGQLDEEEFARFEAEGAAGSEKPEEKPAQ